MMQLPNMSGTIERRLLVNYRVDPDVLRRLLPQPFRPQLIDGVGVAGICLIRLGQLRPAGVPAVFGVTTENAAHRIAVEFDGPDDRRRGVYIPRRDTSSRLTAIARGRLFPGEHHRARFVVSEGSGRYEVAFTSLDKTVNVAVVATTASQLPPGSIFGSMANASAFFRDGSLGYSATGAPGRQDGIELSCGQWRMEPVIADHVVSSFFDDRALFPAGTVELDSALLMRDIPATWKARSQLTSSEASEGTSTQCV